MTATPKREMPVVILCGGQGTRLREHTENLPKPMVEIGDQPILWHIMKLYGAHGFERFVLCLGYKGWAIKQYFLRYHEMRRDFTVTMKGDPPEVAFHNQAGEEDWRVTCAETGADSGTGGRLKLVERYVDADTFCFTYGDAVGTVDLDALLAFHRGHGKIATVTGVHPTSRYGEMKVERRPGGRVQREADGRRGRGLGRLLRLRPRACSTTWATIRRPSSSSSRCRSWPATASSAVFVHEGFWHPMDTYRDWLHLNELWKAGQAPWKVW